MKLEPLPDDEQKAQDQGRIQLEVLQPPTLKTLRTRLLERQPLPYGERGSQKSKVKSQNCHNPQVLHFDGHGFFGKRCNQAGCRKAYKQSATNCECGAILGEAQGYLVFEQSDGTADYVSAIEIGELLGNSQRREQPNSEPGIALVVLSACRSGMSRLKFELFDCI